MVVAHAWHPPLRASVSTWKGLIWRFSYVDVWLQQLATVLRVRVDIERLLKDLLFTHLTPTPIVEDWRIQKIFVDEGVILCSV